MKIEIRFHGEKTSKEVSLKEALTSLVEDALLRGIKGPMLWGHDKVTLVTPELKNFWRISGSKEEILKIRDGWVFFHNWISPECRCGEGYPHNNAKYPGTPAFIPFFLNKVMGESQAALT